MKIEIWANEDPDNPDHGPYRLLDTLERHDFYQRGDLTHYGVVTSFLPVFMRITGEADQSVVVKLDPTKLLDLPVESVNRFKEVPRNKLRFVPIEVDSVGWSTSYEAPEARYEILKSENLTIENIAQLITPETFAVWKRDCFLSKSVVSSLEALKYAIVHRFTEASDLDHNIDSVSTELVNLTASCLFLIRPTRKGHAAVIAGEISEGEGFRPRAFSLNLPSEIPKIQRIFAVRPQDIGLLQSLLPNFLSLYGKNESGTIKPDYEPLRMATQLYEQAYALPYWKARHILWWAAIEALFGNAEDAAIARIYAIFGDGDLCSGFERSIYERSDLPASILLTPANDHKLGNVLPLIYEARNFSAHGDKVPDRFFASVPHPLDGSDQLLDVLAEAATFIIRKTIIGLLDKGLMAEFKDRKARENFWLYKYGLDNRQSTKRLAELKASKGKN